MEHQWPILFGKIASVEQVWSEGRMMLEEMG